MMVQKLVQ
jgi:hypothetical protein